MTIAAIQNRMEVLEARFQTAEVSFNPQGSSTEFSAAMNRVQSHRLGANATRGGQQLSSSQTLSSESALSSLSNSNSENLFPQLTSSSSAFTGASGTAGSAAVVQGMKHLGTPYLWGGTDPAVGLDCSALVQHAYRDIGVELPRVSRDQARMGAEVASIEAAVPGDLVAFGSPVDHIAIYVGNGKILQAPRTGDVVKISEISRPITTIRRVVSANSVSRSRLSGSTTPSGSVGSAAELQYQSLFEASGAKHGIDPALLAAVASVESGFNPSAQSPVGAQGLMQFMPATAAEMGVDAFDPASAIDGAARYLKREIGRFGSIELAAAAYNAGAGAVSKYGGIPPYPETQNYVKKVISAYEARR